MSHSRHGLMRHGRGRSGHGLGPDPYFADAAGGLTPACRACRKRPRSTSRRLNSALNSGPSAADTCVMKVDRTDPRWAASLATAALVLVLGWFAFVEGERVPIL